LRSDSHRRRLGSPRRRLASPHRRSHSSPSPAPHAPLLSPHSRRRRLPIEVPDLWCLGPDPWLVQLYEVKDPNCIVVFKFRAHLRGGSPRLHPTSRPPRSLSPSIASSSINMSSWEKGADCMEELTDEDKAIASEVFEDDKNREMFMKHKNHNVRLLWFRRKIRRLADT
ncbi:hypothetical protein EJB05_11234, partial [Eragrostis curvula]